MDTEEISEVQGAFMAWTSTRGAFLPCKVALIMTTLFSIGPRKQIVSLAQVLSHLFMHLRLIVSTRRHRSYRRTNRTQYAGRSMAAQECFQ